MNSSSEERDTRRREYIALFIIVVILFPALAAMTVGGYGFIVWMLQLIFGPPGHSIG
ncbi:TorE protein [Endozoicomonas sp. (ex Bugula neritina AB1)]|nr:TorE protein [Endozoicomonas sp. (ex Bugula neritina AB1)]